MTHVVDERLELLPRDAHCFGVQAEDDLDGVGIGKTRRAQANRANAAGSRMTAFSSCSKQRLQLVDRESRAPQDGTKCPRADRPGTVNRDCGASGQVIAMAERDERMWRLPRQSRV